MKGRALFVAVAALAMIGFAIVASTGPDPDAVPTREQVESRTMSPFCPGLTLLECPSSQANELREAIVQRIRAGETNQQIDNWLAVNYGQGILGKPKGISSWVIPLLGLGLGVVTVGWVLVSKQRRPMRSPSPLVTPEESARVAKDLRLFAEEGSE